MQQLKNMTLLGWLGIIVLFNGVIIGGTAQLTDLVGAFATNKLVAVAALGNMFLGGLVTMFSTTGTQASNVISDPRMQEQLVKAVLAMRGVESIEVNSRANATLAAIAVDPKIDNIAPSAGATAKVEAIARAG